MKIRYFKSSDEYFKWYANVKDKVDIYTVNIIIKNKYSIKVMYKEV